MVNATARHRHQKAVPSGQIRGDIWKKHLHRQYKLPLPPPFLEVLSKIRKPFIQAITDLCALNAVFDNGKVYLIGDGLNLLPSRRVFSSSQAAFHTLFLCDILEKRMSTVEWEVVVRFNELHSAQSRLFGNFY
jgi:hypothetical protein